MNHLPSMDHTSTKPLVFQSSAFPSERNKKPKRRAVACKACHSLKVKCIPSDFNDTSSPCVRCLKSKKVCEIDVPQVRKKKKPEDRVAELELRLEQLTSQLQQGSSSPMSQSSDNSHNQSPRITSHFSTSHPISSAVKHPVTIQRSSSVRDQQQSLASTPNEYVSESESPEEHRKNRIKKARIIEERFGPKKLQDISSAVTASNQARVDALSIEPIDIIDSGYITLEEARIRFQLYQNVIYEKYPFVCIPDGFDTVRNEQRYLFMTIMAVMGTLRPTTDLPDLESNLAILNVAQRHVMNEVIFIGNKNIELLKSMLLYSVWYNIPEMFHHRRYHIFSGLCISMCYDLALTGRPYFVVNKNDGAFRRTTLLEEHQKEEYRSLILTVYAESTGYMTFLRRKLAVTWTPYMEECCNLLRSSNEPRYRTIAVIAKLTSLMEKIDLFLGSHDQENHPLIKHFATEIEVLRTDPTTLDANVLKAFSASIEAFLYSKFSSKVLALKCLRATMDCLEGFAEMSPAEMNSVPLLIFGRLMYCFALFLRTCNILKYDFDLAFIDKLLDKLKVCTESYKNNHILLKIRLLLHFYLTTFAKNEDVFNSINEVSSTYSIAKTYDEQSPTDYPRSELHDSTSVPNLNSMLKGVRRNSQVPSDLLRHSLSQQTPEETPMLPPVNPHGSVNQLPLRSTTASLPGTYALPSHNGQNVAHTNNTMPLNDPFGLFNGNTTGNELFENGVPRLDMLSDATTKGFLDVPNDLLTSQDDFWKIFDYKQDDQFYL